MMMNWDELGVVQGVNCCGGYDSTCERLVMAMENFYKGIRLNPFGYQTLTVE